MIENLHIFTSTQKKKKKKKKYKKKKKKKKKHMKGNINMDSTIIGQ
jgi:hypothetical protein